MVDAIHVGDIHILYGTEDPAVDEIVAPPGSLFIKTDTATLYIQNGVGPSGWQDQSIPPLPPTGGFAGFFSGTEEPGLQNLEFAFWFDTNAQIEWMISKRGGVVRKVELS